MINRYIKLPIQMNEVACVTECWSFNRLAIIKNSPYYDDWLASHYDLYVDTEFRFHFGDAFINPPYYYEPILKRKHINMFQIPDDNIVETIKIELSQGNYMIVYIKPYEDQEYFHEALFYGYDDESENFFTAGIKDAYFQEIKYPYSYIQKTFRDVKTYFLDNHYFGNYLSLYYYYPLTAFCLRDDYNPEHCTFEAYAKLDKELYGECHKVLILKGDGKFEESGIIYQGMNCLYGFRRILMMTICGEDFPKEFKGVINAAKKMQEHQKLILHSMKYLLQKWLIVMSAQSNYCIFEYYQCYNVVEKWLRMILKYEYSKNIDLLKKIVAEIPTIFEKEDT